MRFMMSPTVMLAALVTLSATPALSQKVDGKDAGKQAAIQKESEIDCGPLENPVGPFDYSSQETETVRLRANVEYNHFNQDVRSLQGGQTAVGPMSDLDYVLRAFPNHPLALSLVARYQQQGGKQGRFRSAECYFDRAKRFVPNDPVVHMLHGIYLVQNGKHQPALAEYEAALAISPEYTEAHYNIGLLLVKLGRLDEARVHAQKAYASGYPLDGLRNQLIRLNAWQTPARSGTSQ
jgi:tetratricopeptide (TPR) repeat protein